MPTLHYNHQIAGLIPLEAECLTPDQLLGKSIDQIARLPVWHGNHSASLGEFFHIEATPPDEVHLFGDLSRVKYIGHRMSQGCLIVHGSVGMHAGAEMTGGQLHIHGDAGDWLGAEMHGGRIWVHGSAADLAGAAYRGARRGMRGGEILIDGNAGQETGITMRRGLIAVGGRLGDFSGGGLIAGTLLAFAAAGARLGAGMKRGTVALFAEAPPLLPSFTEAGVIQPLFLELYLRHLRALGFAPARLACRPMRRWCGDRLSLGKGEILTPIA
ncbi:MAG: formylmethanofuran dehydrogenase subunit C [Gemmataceae bacterium]